MVAYKFCCFRQLRALTNPAAQCNSKPSDDIPSGLKNKLTPFGITIKKRCPINNPPNLVCTPTTFIMLKPVFCPLFPIPTSALPLNSLLPLLAAGLLQHCFSPPSLT